MKKLLLTISFIMISMLSHGLILNWYIENDSRYSKEICYAQLVGEFIGSSEDQKGRPSSIYSFLIQLDAGGVHEYVESDIGSWSELNLTEYLTTAEAGDADLPIGYMSEFGFKGVPYEDVPAEFNFNDYVFHFRMLDENMNIIGLASSPYYTSYEGPIGWDDLYNQYIFDAAHLKPDVWVVGVPEANSICLIVMGLTVVGLCSRGPF